MREIKVGQVWVCKFGPKDNKSLAYVVGKLNARCWEIEEDSETRIINTDELIREYSFQSDK